MKKSLKILFLLIVVLCLCQLVYAGGKKEEGKEPVEKIVEVEQMGPVNDNPLSDVRVRYAIAYAIDKKMISERLFGGAVVPANSLTPDGPWKREGLNDYAYNRQKARELLEEANWDPDYELDLVYYYGDQLTVDICTVIQSFLGDVGIKCNIRKVEGDLNELIYAKPKDPVYGPSGVDWDLCYAAVAATSQFHYFTRFLPGHGSTTPANDYLVDLIKQASSTPVVEEQKEWFAKIHEFENKFMLTVPLYYMPIFTAESDRLSRNGEMYGNEQYNYDWKIQNWTVEPDEQGKKIMRTNGGPVEFFRSTIIDPGIFASTKIMWDHLIKADGNLASFRPQMAEDYTVSEDGLTISFTLKDGLKWHDGKPITVEDVKFTVELAAKAPTKNPVFVAMTIALEGYKDYVDGDADGISGIVIDGNTVTFNFASLDPNALLAFSQLAILPKEHLKDINPNLIQQHPFWQRPIGSGPFKIKDVEMNNYAIYVPFEDYHEGVAKIEEIHLYPSDESDPHFVANAKAGRIDYGFTKSVEDLFALKEMDHMTVHSINVNYTRFLYVNQFPKK